ncbi:MULTISPECIES: hypothetical protein [Eubacteriales]|uniref:hypothetical protein n=1 Tax=Eubacteriales TaxID=186802 RepID=UPI002AC9BE5E|nr:hypothetical protein [Acutalibacter sp. M00118]
MNPLREDVISLLNAFGVTGAEADPLIDFVLDSVVERVKNETNLNTIPEGLKKLAVEMVLGQYLSLKKNLGQLEGFDLEAAVKQIQEGDTNTVFAIGEGNTTPEQRLDTLINYLINGRNREFIRYRRVVW